jgi:transcriptional adapter 3
VQWDEREDDEISIKLRELQAKLREQSKRNNYRKQVLIEKVKAQIGWQQYQSYLETLDTQIEEAYLARFVSIYVRTLYYLLILLIICLIYNFLA